jgi:hypothetical protein
MIELFNTDFMKLIAVLVAIVAVVIVYLRHRPNELSPSNIHLWYISSILIFLIIELVTYVVVGNSESDEMMSYISFASTLSSMILSIIAIFITVVSNDSILGTKEIFQELSKDVKCRVENSVGVMNKVSQDVETITLKNKESQDETIKQIQNLLASLDDHICRELEKNNKRIDTVNKNLNDLTRKGSLSFDADDSIPDNLYTRFFTNTSYLSLQIICAFDEYEKQHLSGPISISKLLGCFKYKEDSNLELYVFACIVMLASVGAIKYALVTQNDFDKILVGGMNENFRVAFNTHFDKTEKAVETRECLTSYYNNLSKDNTDNEDQEQK